MHALSKVRYGLRHGAELMPEAMVDLDYVGTKCTSHHVLTSLSFSTLTQLPTMPLHLPKIGHHRRASSNTEQRPSPESFVPTTASRTPTSPLSPQPRDLPLPLRSSTTSSDSSAPPSILRKVPTASSTDDGSVTSSSAYLSKRMSKSLAFDRTDTISSLPESDDEDFRTSSTPATSVSSFGGQCPLPTNTPTQKFPFFVMTLSGGSTLSFIALPIAMRPKVLDAVQRAWKRGISKSGQVEYAPELMKKHKEKGCEGGVWEVTMKGECWVPSSSEKVSSVAPFLLGALGSCTGPRGY